MCFMREGMGKVHGNGRGWAWVERWNGRKGLGYRIMTAVVPFLNTKMLEGINDVFAISMYCLDIDAAVVNALRLS